MWPFYPLPVSAIFSGVSLPIAAVRFEMLTPATLVVTFNATAHFLSPAYARL